MKSPVLPSVLFHFSLSNNTLLKGRRLMDNWLNLQNSEIFLSLSSCTRCEELTFLFLATQVPLFFHAINEQTKPLPVTYVTFAFLCNLGEASNEWPTAKVGNELWPKWQQQKYFSLKPVGFYFVCLGSLTLWKHPPEFSALNGAAQGSTRQ